MCSETHMVLGQNPLAFYAKLSVPPSLREVARRARGRLSAQTRSVDGGSASGVSPADVAVLTIYLKKPLLRW